MSAASAELLILLVIMLLIGIFARISKRSARPSRTLSPKITVIEKDSMGNPLVVVDYDGSSRNKPNTVATTETVNTKNLNRQVVSPK
jgi:hypothetical protein